MKKSFLIVCAFAALFASCGSDTAGEAPITEKEGQPIFLTSGITQSRAGIAIQNTQFLRGQIFDVFINEVVPDGYTGELYPYDQPIIYQALDNKGSIRPRSSVFPYYPTNGHNINIYAIYPEGAFNSSTFTVKTDQSMDKDYMACDLMYAEKKDVKKTQDAVPLVFNHKLAKVIVTLQSGSGGKSMLTGSTVTIGGTMDKDGNINGGDGGLYTSIAFNSTTGELGELQGTKSIITLTGNGANSSACIIPPQSVKAGYFITIKTSGNDELNYRLPQEMKFEPGTVNTFTIQVNQSNLEATYTVEAWNDVDMGKKTLHL